MRFRDASEKVNGKWQGGLEGKDDAGVDIFFDNGKIEIGVHDGEQGAIVSMSAYHALRLASLLVKAAND